MKTLNIIEKTATMAATSIALEASQKERFHITISVYI